MAWSRQILSPSLKDYIYKDLKFDNKKLKYLNTHFWQPTRWYFESYSSKFYFTMLLPGQIKIWTDFQLYKLCFSILSPQKRLAFLGIINFIKIKQRELHATVWETEKNVLLVKGIPSWKGTRHTVTGNGHFKTWGWQHIPVPCSPIPP